MAVTVAVNCTAMLHLLWFEFLKETLHHFSDDESPASWEDHLACCSTFALIFSFFFNLHMA